jgi:hypothetical protein
MRDAVELASIYRLTATNFRMSAEVLAAHFRNQDKALPGNRLAIPFYYLISHAMELLLKCALLKRGLTEVDLRKYPVRHGLGDLLQKVKELGVPVSENASKVILALSPQHEEHRLRYSAMLDDGKTTFTPEPDVLFETLDELLMAGRISTHGR